MASGGAIGPRTPILQGGSPIACWNVENLTVHEDSNRTQWRYVLWLRDATGGGLHLTRVTRNFIGPEFRDWDQQSLDIDLQVPAGGVVDFPCGHSVWARRDITPRQWYLTERRTYSGTDGKGRSVQVEVDLPFGDVQASPQPASLLFFAGFTAFRALVTTPPCESLARKKAVFDVNSDRDGSVNFLVAIDTVRRQVAVKTRWLSPSGEEIQTEEGIIHAEFVWGGYLYTHATHTLSSRRIGTRVGQWRVELYLDGKLQGIYPFEVRNLSN